MTCLQAIWISDAVLGARSVDTRAAFINQLQAECIEATTEDLQHLVKPAKEGPSVASGPQLFKSKPSISSSSSREHAGAFRATTDSGSKLGFYTALCQHMIRGPHACITIDAAYTS